MEYAAIYRKIIQDPRYQANLDWGKPRDGHPEGTIRAHIADLERNLGHLDRHLSETDHWRLKIAIHVHDTFKPEATNGVKISDPRSHASLARAFLAEFCNDEALLALVQLHDEPYALYQQFAHKGVVNQQRIASLIRSIPEWNLFLAFCIIDGCTTGKSRNPLLWLFIQIEGKVTTAFSTVDIL